MLSYASLTGRWLLHCHDIRNETVLMSNWFYPLKFVNNPVPFKSNRQIEICLLLTKNNCLLSKKISLIQDVRSAMDFGQGFPCFCQSHPVGKGKFLPRQHSNGSCQNTGPVQNKVLFVFLFEVAPM